MTEEAPQNPGPFDVQTIKQLIGLMSRNNLSEIDLRDGTQRICLRRGVTGVTMIPGQAVPLPQPVAVPAPAPVAPAAPQPAAPAAKAEPAPAAKNLVEIKSPTVGTFYAKPKPDAEPFVRVGTRVTPTSPIGLIEAMKIFSEIPAECSGVIAEILVENQQPVEYGQVLFRVDPAA